MSEANLLEANHLTKAFSKGGLFRKGSVTAVDDVSFSMPGKKAVVTSIVGESGSGKSTIAGMILLFTKPTSGDLKYRGKSILNLSRGKTFQYRKEVQAIFQDPYETYNPFYKVDRILEIPVRTFKLASTKDERQQIVAEALDAVGLPAEEVLGKHPHQLSGGQRQRLMIARAFITKPKLIVADEPVSMVDASLRAGILEAMLDLKRKSEISYLYITHDLSTAYYLSDQMIVLFRGSAVEWGDVNEVIGKPAHPYLQVLISSVPRPDPEKRWKEKVPFKVTNLYEEDSVIRGCKFYSRCPNANDRCARERPEVVNIGKDHFVTCFAAD